jgi:hypothetical protein
MKKPPYRFYSFGVDGGATAIGIEPGTIMVVGYSGSTSVECKEYRAPIEKIHAAMARMHVKEHPSGRKRSPEIPLYRLEKDMINVAKFVIQRAGISSPAFVALARKAFTIAQRETHR